MPSDTLPPYFPATVPSSLEDPHRTADLLEPVLADLSDVVSRVGADDLQRPTPCTRMDVEALRDHVVGWVQFFAAALADPQRSGPRPDADGYRGADDEGDPADRVREAGSALLRAAREDGTVEQVVLAASRMDRPALLAMILGEYVLHGWDLARALDVRWEPSSEACEASLAFFRGMIAPEYRVGESAYFGPEVSVPDDAPALERLLGFAGRDPAWCPAVRT
jgi:uncharacterized protein (TIGR03086 family)